MKTYNIMELVEGKKYKDQNGITWEIDKNNFISDECGDDLMGIVDESRDIIEMVFTEVKEPLTITLEAEELELLKKAWRAYSIRGENDACITNKLNGIK